MKKFASLTVLIAIGFLLGCSTSEKRTKWTDKNMRLMIDPDSIGAGDYVSVQTAFVKQGSFTIVDRSSGFKAIKSEQERTHRNEEDRYAAKERWSQWGKLYGVGAIVVGHSQCYRAKPWFSQYSTVNRCKQFLSLVDSNTGEVIVAVDGEIDSPATVDGGSFSTPPDWTETVEKLIEIYPKDFKPQYYSDKLENYRAVSEEEAKRQREATAEKDQ